MNHTTHFIEKLWYRWGQILVTQICDLYSLDAEQRRAMEFVFLKPNDWQVQIAEPLGTAGTAVAPLEVPSRSHEA